MEISKFLIDEAYIVNHVKFHIWEVLLKRACVSCTRLSELVMLPWNVAVNPPPKQLTVKKEMIEKGAIALELRQVEGDKTNVNGLTQA